MADGDDNDDGRKPSVIPGIVGEAAAAALGVRLGSPEVAIGLGASGRLFASLAEHVWDELRPDAKRRTAQMLNTTAETAGWDADELGERIGASEATRLQAGLAMNAAERTAWPPQVRALGRVLADGLIAEGDAVDVPQFALSAMVEMDRLHVTLLDILVRYEPVWAGDRIDARPHHEVAHLPWRIGGRVWVGRAITAVRPQLTEVLPGVAGTLIRHGLAEQADRRIEAMEQLTRDLRQRVNQQVSSPASRAPTPTPPLLRSPMAGEIERTWSPTQIGQRVLGYYLEAGSEEDAQPAG